MFTFLLYLILILALGWTMRRQPLRHRILVALVASVILALLYFGLDRLL